MTQDQAIQAIDAIFGTPILSPTEKALGAQLRHARELIEEMREQLAEHGYFHCVSCDRMVPDADWGGYADDDGEESICESCTPGAKN